MRPDSFGHRPRRVWDLVRVTLPAQASEAAAAIVAEVTGGGVEVRPAAPGPDGDPRETVVGYLEATAGSEAATEAAVERVVSRLGALERAVGGAEFELEREEHLVEEDWGAVWREHFRPFRAAPGLLVRPSWEPCEPAPGEAVIEMDPGMAFGTGLHASTRLALGLMRERFAAAVPARVLDVGTGTGILAMAAALWGATEVHAVDSDPDAVAAAAANVARNGLAPRVRVGAGLEGARGPFGLVVANITADVLESLAPLLGRLVGPGGALVLSGLLAGGQVEGVLAACLPSGLRTELRRGEGEWEAVLLAAPEEVFELVDLEGRVVGRAPRSECHRNPELTHRAAHVVVLDRAGRLYLQRRSLAKDIQPGRWDTSVGGHLDVGEDHAAAARREMLEELGLEGELRFLHRYLWRTERETELVETFLHLAAAEPRPLAGEVEEGRWFTRAELEALLATGACTPNLEEELRRIEATGLLGGG